MSRQPYPEKASPSHRISPPSASGEAGLGLASLARTSLSAVSQVSQPAQCPADPANYQIGVLFPLGSGRSTRQRAFTMVELMLVIMIGGMIMAIGLPTAFYVLQKDPMRQAVTDITEICSMARGEAIIKGVTCELVFHIEDRTLRIQAGQAPPKTMSDDLMALESEPRPAPKSASAANSTKTISDQLILEMVDVNFVELKDEPEARIRFFPNGTSDEFTMVLHWPEKQQYRKISLDILTGLADLEIIK